MVEYLYSLIVDVAAEPRPHWLGLGCLPTPSLIAHCLWLCVVLLFVQVVASVMPTVKSMCTGPDYMQEYMLKVWLLVLNVY